MVLLSAVLDRASAAFGVAARVARAIDGACRPAVQRAALAVPFAVFPLALFGLSVGFTSLVASAHAREGPAAMHRDVPLDFLYLRDPAWHTAYNHIAPLLFTIVVAQSLLLGGLYVRVRARPLARADVAVACLATVGFFIAALRVRVLESTDLYNYIVYARLGMTHAYAPGIVVDDPALRRVTALTWGVLPPSPYGPLWQLYNGAIANASTLADAATRLRLFNAFALLTLFGGLVAARVPAAGIAILALNPYLYDQYVANAHNDLLPIVLLTLACVFARRRSWPLGVAVVLAGLVKLPFVLVGLATLGAIASMRERIAVAVASVTVVLGLSFALGGQAYFRALVYASEADRHESVEHIAAVVLAIFAVGLMFLTQRRYWPGLLAVPSLRSFDYPWYLIWLVPLAYAGRSVYPIAIAFPVVGFLLSDVYVATRLERVATYITIAVVVAATAPPPVARAPIAVPSDALRTETP